MSEAVTCLLPNPNAAEPAACVEPDRRPNARGGRSRANAKSDRVAGADGLRALACLWVFGHHVCQLWQWPRDGVSGFFRTHGPQGVAVFFVLSRLLLSLPFWQAFVAGDGFPNLKKYVMKRLARIVPGYCLCLGVMFAIYHDITAADLLRLLSAVTFTNSFHWRTYFPVKLDGACWSIGVKMMFYVLLPLWAAGWFRLKCLAAGRLFCVVTMAGLIGFQLVLSRWWPTISAPTTEAPHDFHQLATEWLPFRNPVGLFSHFLFGCLAASFFVRSSPFAPAGGEGPGVRGSVSRGVALNRWDLLAITTLAALWCELYLMSWNWLPQPVAGIVASLWSRRELACMNFGWPAFPLLVAILLVALSRSATVAGWFDNRILQKTATLSFGIYLWHTPVLHAIHEVWPVGIDLQPLWPAAFVAAALASSYAVAWLSFRVVEKPALDLARRAGF
jgi:peptidoglycan/LPS O-acetylase OafA/YrhL